EPRDRSRRLARDGERAVMPMSLLKEPDSRFRLMADGAPVMLWICDADKRFTYFNEGWLRFTGRSETQETGLGWTEGVHPQDLREYLDTFSAAAEARQPFRMEFRLRRHDGDYRWVLNTGTPLYGSDGAFQGFVGSCIDVTELKESREQLTRLVA